MSRRRYYFLALWLPILFPLALCSVWSWLSGMVFSITIPYMLLCYTLPIAGWQYGVFAVTLSLIFYSKNNEYLYKLSWFLPMLFIPVFIAGLHITAFLDENRYAKSMDLGSFGVFSALALGWGYFYVFAAHLLGKLLIRGRLIEE